MPQNSREAKKILQYKLSLALKQLRHLAVRVKPISFALRACFLGHYRMARMSQSASPCGLASWMRPHMVPDAHLLKLLFPTRYTSRSIHQSSMCDSQSASSCELASWMRTQECSTSMISDTHLLKLLTPRSIYQSSMCDSQSASSCGFASLMRLSTIYYIYDALLPFPYKTQKSLYNRQIFA